MDFEILLVTEKENTYSSNLLQVNFIKFKIILFIDYLQIILFISTGCIRKSLYPGNSCKQRDYANGIIAQ